MKKVLKGIAVISAIAGAIFAVVKIAEKIEKEEEDFYFEE